MLEFYRCFATNKINYPHRRAALEGAKHWRKRIGSRTKPYKCPHCQNWHLTHRNRRKVAA